MRSGSVEAVHHALFKVFGEVHTGFFEGIEIFSEALTSIPEVVNAYQDGTGTDDRYPKEGSPPASAPVVHRDCSSAGRARKIFEGEGYYLLLSGIYGGRSGSYQAQVLGIRCPAFRGLKKGCSTAGGSRAPGKFFGDGVWDEYPVHLCQHWQVAQSVQIDQGPGVKNHRAPRKR